MKFGDKFLDSAYFGVIKPTIEKYGFKPLRIDEVQDSGRITDQVLEGIATSKYIFADLTGERPNCYYEVGFAHAIGKEMILAIKKGNRIHFDLADYRFIEWETELELREALCKRFSTIKQSGFGQPNPA
jgi:nucleoside 2-deoxyribosyltransferase